MTTKNAAIFVDVIRDQDRTRFGNTYPGRVSEGHKAEIVVGIGIRLHGVDYSTSRNPVQYLRSFAIGDTATYDSYNMVYTGTITSITAKTVTIVEEGQRGRTRRLSIYEFDWRNWRFDAVQTAERNLEWLAGG